MFFSALCEKKKYVTTAFCFILSVNILHLNKCALKTFCLYIIIKVIPVCQLLLKLPLEIESIINGFVEQAFEEFYQFVHSKTELLY